MPLFCVIYFHCFQCCLYFTILPFHQYLMRGNSVFNRTSVNRCSIRDFGFVFVHLIFTVVQLLFLPSQILFGQKRCVNTIFLTFMFQWQDVLDIISKALTDNNMEFTQINRIKTFQVCQVFLVVLTDQLLTEIAAHQLT